MPSTQYPIFVFLKDRRFFYATFLKFVFIKAPSVQETKRFASVKGSSTFLALCAFRRPSSKNFPENFEIFFLNFLFLRFSVEKDVFFCCFQLGKNGFRDLCVSLRVFFGAVKLMKFQHYCPFTLGCPYYTAHLVFF